MSTIKGNWYDLNTCDRCPQARARAVFILNSGNQLYLCGHCSTKHSAAIEQYLDVVIYAPALKEENRAVGAVH